MKQLTHLQVAAAFALLSSPSQACTTCDSALAKAVREEVLGPDFWPHVGFTILPFVIVLAITAVIHYGFPRRLANTDNNTGTAKGEAV